MLGVGHLAVRGRLDVGVGLALAASARGPGALDGCGHYLLAFFRMDFLGACLAMPPRWPAAISGGRRVRPPRGVVPPRAPLDGLRTGGGGRFNAPPGFFFRLSICMSGLGVAAARVI